MHRIGSLLLIWYVIILSLPVVSFGQDLVDSIFQPSKNLEHVINIWNNKNAVWNEIFRGSTDIDINITKQCFMKELVNQTQCEAQKKLRTRHNNECYIRPATTISDEGACVSQWGTWKRGKDIWWSSLNFTPRPSLLIRILQTLMRLTIALSIPVLIFVGVKVIKNGLTNGDYKSALQEVSHVLIGLVIALSAVGIIYIIQSIVTRTLPGIFL